MEDGIGPTRALDLKLSAKIDVSLPMDAGIVPTISFENIDSVVRLERFPTASGRVPAKLLFERFSAVTRWIFVPEAGAEHVTWYHESSQGDEPR